MIILPQLVLFFGLNLALAALFARIIRPARPAVRLVLGFTAGLVLQFLFCFAIYAANLPWPVYIALPLVVGGLILRRPGPVLKLLGDREVRGILVSWLLISAWSLSLHALIVSYSGGGWTADQFEHHDRVRFFLEHWPQDTRFLGIYGLTSRPPLVNLVMAGWMSVTGGRFIDYQIFSTLLSCAAFLPLGLLVRRLGGSRRSIAVLALLLMLNPIWAQNTTFPWTKLPTAIFILLAIERCLAGLPRARNQPAAIALLAAGGLAHYSTGPWAIALAFAWLAATSRHWRDSNYWKQAGQGLLLAGALIAPWLIWAALRYGLDSLWLETSTARDHTPHGVVTFLQNAGANLWHTFVPAAESPVRDIITRQSNIWGRVRDITFNLYQHTLPLGLGVGGLFLLALGRRPPMPDAYHRRFWLVLIGSVLPLSMATVPFAVDMGLAHICLQSLVLLCITLNAAVLNETSRRLRLFLTLALGIDLLLGVILHFSVQNFWFSPWGDPSRLIYQLNEFAGYNYRAKIMLGQPFLADRLAPFTGLPLLCAVLAFGIGLCRARPWTSSRAHPRAPDSPPPSQG